MIATKDEMDSARLNPDQRDYCAHILLRLLACKSETWPWVYKCHHQKENYLECEFEEWVNPFFELDNLFFGFSATFCEWKNLKEKRDCYAGSNELKHVRADTVVIVINSIINVVLFLLSTLVKKTRHPKSGDLRLFLLFDQPDVFIGVKTILDFFFDDDLLFRLSHFKPFTFFFFWQWFNI